MSRLTLHTLSNAPEASRPLLERSFKNNGYLPNLVALLAGAPEALEGYLTLGQINAQGALSLAEREVVQITAAVIHGCDFCTAGHSAIALKKAGFTKESVLALHQGQPTGEARLDALSTFTREVIAARGAVGDEALRTFLAADFNERQALDVVLGVSLATLCNFANNLGQPALNPELEPYRRGVLGG